MIPVVETRYNGQTERIKGFVTLLAQENLQHTLLPDASRGPFPLATGRLPTAAIQAATVCAQDSGPLNPQALIKP